MKRLLIFQIIAILILGLLIFVALMDNLDKPSRFLNPVQAFEEPIVEEIVTRTPLPTIIPTQTATNLPLELPTQTIAVSPTQPPPTATALPTNPPARNWKDWPSLPAFVSDSMRDVYQQGLELGNNPHAFSVLGDCQSQPDVFLGIYDRDPSFVNNLPFALRPVVSQFRGSFDRYSPTVKDGTTEGSLLWMGWNDNKEGYCTAGESPLDCELRVHRPSIAFIHVGTHWATRNERYLTTIIEKLIENGTVPVIVTKADNRELDERINQTLIRLAEKYELPVWNFWASAQPLPNHGMLKGSTMYLSDEGLLIHQQEALEVLYSVWQALKQ